MPKNATTLAKTRILVKGCVEFPLIDAELGYKNACVLAEAAQKAGLEMMISMEGTEMPSLSASGERER